MNFTIQQLKIIYDSLEDKELSIIDGTYQKEVFEIKKIQVIIFNEIIKKQEIKKINKDNKKIKDEIIKEDTGYLSNFSNLYIAKQTPYVMKRVKDHLHSQWT